jgi:Predicted nucleoside-diphosphate-sugar epimerases
MRLVVRDPARAPQIGGAEVVAADYGDPAGLADALKPGDRVFMVSLHESPERRVPLHRSFIEAAARAGVAQVVYLSFANAGPDAIFLHARTHGATEAMLADAGVPFTAVRNTMYADDLAGWFDDDGVAREPAGDARMSFSWRPELARVVARALTEDGHEGRVYDIVTPESVSLGQLAAIASRATGREFRYEPATDADWVDRWTAAGQTGWHLDVGLSVYAALRAGEFDVVTGDYEAVTGEKPATIEQLAAQLF